MGNPQLTNRGWQGRLAFFWALALTRFTPQDKTKLQASAARAGLLGQIIPAISRAKEAIDPIVSEELSILESFEALGFEFDEAVTRGSRGTATISYGNPR